MGDEVQVRSVSWRGGGTDAGVTPAELHEPRDQDPERSREQRPRASTGFEPAAAEPSKDRTVSEGTLVTTGEITTAQIQEYIEGHAEEDPREQFTVDAE
jgi:hypothetical protein